MLQPHIKLDGSLGIRCAILPGDPARVDKIVSQLDGPQELAFNREYRSAWGTYRGVRVLAMSTGMGGASVVIGLEELRNIGITHCIRIGSCGALQKGIGLGDLVLASGAVRDDGASRTYAPDTYPAVPDLGLLNACVESAREHGFPFEVGVVRSHDSFYIDDIDQINEAWSKRGVLGSDMETAPVLTVARLRGMRAASILNNVVVWGQDTSESIGAYADGESLTAIGEKREITVALDALAKEVGAA